MSAVALIAVGCEPTAPQWILICDTDAPVARERASTLADPIPLFDALRIDVMTPGCTSGCSRTFDVTEEAFRKRAISFGVAATTKPLTVRARLYLRRLASFSGEPNPSSTIDVSVTLPPLAGEVRRASLFLATDDVASPRSRSPGPDITVSKVATWPKGARTRCVGDPGADEACVPGGAFWLGSHTDELVPNVGGGWHRLAVLSPFFVDRVEVSAATYRSNGGKSQRWPGSNTANPYDPLNWCTVADVASTRDPLPANCMSQLQAANYCMGLGKDLPTEVQLEYLEGGLSNNRYVWGEDAPIATMESCGWAVWGRERTEPCTHVSSVFMLPGGPELPRQSTRDRVLSLGGLAIDDLEGNVGEWARGSFAETDDPCFDAPILVDPVCTNDSGRVPLHGGTWESADPDLTAGARAFFPKINAHSPSVGVRCARPGT